MNGHAGIDTVEATEHLKNILNVGKSETETGKIKSVSNGDMEGAGDSNLVLSNSPYQKIELNAERDSYHSSVYGNEVDIYASPLVYGATCSQIIVDNLVDYGWEEKYYSGRLIGIHMSGKYIAYVLKPSSLKPGYVRILNLLTQKKHLIKLYEGEVKDIAFAHSTSQILLGSVDITGAFFVHQVTDDEDELICNLILHIFRPDWLPVEYNRIIWCLYIPDDNEDDSVDDDVSSLLVVTHNERAEIWNIQTVIKEHGKGSISIDDVKCGVQVISEHKSPISAATFSPDGSALAIGSVDGVVKFFQVNTLVKDVSPRCLHQWTPHGDKPLSSLYFLDNHKNHKPDVQFWKFAVTGAENNTEIKVWCCETWACLQTIRIHANPNDCVLPSLKAEMDLASKYLILSDIKRKVILVFLIQQDLLASSASVKCVSEFRVPFPVLSLAISSVSSSKKCPIASGEENSDEEEENEQTGDASIDYEESGNKLIVKLFWIQTKTLQFCRITYSPKMESSLHSVGSVSSLSQDSFGFKDGLSDISIDAKDLSNRSMRDLDMSLQKSLCGDKLSISSQSSVSNITSLTSHINFSNCAEVLLTPDDFTSPSHSNLSAQSSFAHHDETKTSSSKCDSSPRISDEIDSLPVEPNTMQRRKSSQHSATSSPSREVAEIMAPAKGLPLDEIVLETPTVKMQEGIETLGNALSSFAISSGVPSRSQPDYHMKEWPEAPDPSKEYGMSKRTESDDNHSKHFMSSEPSTVELIAGSNQIIYQLNERFEEMMSKIEALKELSSSQRIEIQSLQTELKSLQDQQHKQINTSVSNKFDHVISQHLVPSYSRIEQLITKSFEDEQIQREQGLAVMTSTISSNCGNRMDNTLKQELTNSILPQVTRFLDTIAQKMQLDYTQKLGATDAAIKETLNKHLKGKAFVDSLSQSISSSLQSAIQTACKEVFQISVVPAFEKSCQHLFHQLNELFQKGTSDYVQVMEKNSISACSLLESLTSQLKDEIVNLTATQQSICSQTILTESRSMELLKKQEALMANLRHIVHEEVLRAFKDQTSALNSRSVTPVPHNDPALKKQLLIQLVKSGNMDEAFQQALSAMDVQLVIFLCENVNVDQIFGVTPCPLQQHVLLSLVNQLSADLSVKTDIKIRYIEDVITTLDSSDPIIKDHIHSVLENLQQRITTFLQKYPTHKFNRNLKRISLAVISLLSG